MDTGKEDTQFSKYDKFGQCFMASTLCAGSLETQTGYSIDSCGKKEITPT